MTHIARPDGLSGLTVLLVEDDFLVAEALAALLAGEGASVLGPIGWADEVVEFIEMRGDRFDIALLDVDLHGAKSYGIAAMLRERGIGFVFMTGYGEETIDAAFRDCARCEKPIHRDELLAALSRAIAGKAGTERTQPGADCLVTDAAP